MIRESLQASILARLREAPERPSLCFYGPQQVVHWRSRQEVYQSSVSIARYLQAYGVRRGDVCIILLPSGEMAATCLIATLLAGAIPLLIAPPALVGGNLEVYETVRSALRRAKPRVLVCSPASKPDLADLEKSFPATSFLTLPPAHVAETSTEPFAPFAPTLPGSADIAAMQLTSGTTAMPRICVWDQKGMLAALAGMQAAMQLAPSDICVNWTPLYHDMGLVNNLLLCLAYGTPLVLLSPQDFIRRPALWLRSLSATRATTTWSPNFGFAVAVRKIRDDELEGVRLDEVRGFWNAAERIHPESIDAFYDRFAPLGVKREALKTNFGCAENIGGATFSDLTRPPIYEHLDRRLFEERGIARVSTTADHPVVVVGVGRPHPTLLVRILSRRGAALPDGQVGEIALETPSRMLCYHQNTGETRRAFRGGLLRTGDLGYLRDGELFWIGRVRERITIHGKKLDPSSFESTLNTIPGLRPGCFAAFGVPDERLGTERLILVTEVGLSEAEDLQRLASTISKRCFLELGISPAEVVLVRPGTLAKTSSGKRRHRYFRRLYLAGGLESARLRAASGTGASSQQSKEGPAVEELRPGESALK
jgi:fatty-acyl-CoA synthase